MSLREDEIAFLGDERCYCGHLETLHETEGPFLCRVDEGPHHFCSAEAERRHFEMTAREVGNPEVGRVPRCQACAEGRSA